MLDKRTALLLGQLNTICLDETYKVIEIKELCSKMPSKLKVNSQSLLESIKHLVERNYISLKYFDEDVFCLSILPKGRLFKEKSEELALVRSKKFELAWIAMLCGAVGAFLGSAFATILILLII